MPVLAIALLTVAACSSDGTETDPGSVGSDATAETTGSPDTAAVTSTDSDDTVATPTTTTPETASTSPGATFDFSAVSPVVQAFVDSEGLNGAGLIVVDRDTGVIHEDYWGEFDADRVSLVASSSKMITAGVLLHLDDQGLLDMDAPVADVTPWGAGNPDIAPAQLLSNSSGLVGLLPNPGFAPYVCQYIVAGTMQACAEQIFTTPDDDADVVPPDTEFRYGGAQWQVAGALAEIASGKSWAELIDEVYVEPCDLETLGYTNQWTQSQLGASGFEYPTKFDADPSTLLPTDNPNMEGGAFITTGDYAKLLLMQLRDGMCGDTQVLSTESLDQMHADRIGAVYNGDARPGVGYGMGWWVERESGRISDPGAYGAVPWLDLEDGYGAYLVVESDAVTGNILAAQLYDIVDTAVTIAT
jgi:CubicO group peptidase (beta-lactamase class C family)